jgi:hypothetical protein
VCVCVSVYLTYLLLGSRAHVGPWPPECVSISPQSLLGDGSVEVPLSLLGNGSVKIPLGRNVTAVTNTHATIDDLLDASFLMWPVSYQGK